MAAAAAAAAAAAGVPTSAGGGSSGGVAAAAAAAGYWPNAISTAAMGLAAHDLLHSIMPHTAWAELGSHTAACFHAGLSPAVYWQYLTAAALLSQPPSSAAMLNAARAYHYFQQSLAGLASDWLEDRTPSLASSAASEESAKESPAIERADRVSEAVDGAGEDEDMCSDQPGGTPSQHAAGAGAAAAAANAAAAAAAGGGGGAAAPAAAAVRHGRRKRHAAETDSEQDEASSRRKYR
jgi:hypothetical protein